jgi:peptidoglycan/xylan/chitin deacetylase (PgdA/CDA1 family)
MIMSSRIRSFLLTLDRLISRTPLALEKKEGVLLSFLFHSVYLDASELKPGVVDPQQAITVEMLRRFFEHFQRNEYTFVSAADLAKGLGPGGKYVLATFDDGYYNNTRVLPILAEFQAPAVFFIPTGHVRHGKAYWWDVLERETHKRGVPRARVRAQSARLKRLPTAQAESELRLEFGAAAFKPLGDLDRPFTTAELRDFARHQFVSLGNHTADHAILINYSAEQAWAQIQQAQDDIRAITGHAPDMIAYPNGEDSSAVVEIARKLGLRFGLTVNPGANRLPLRPGSRPAMNLRRFTLQGDQGIDAQCYMSRASVSLYRSARRLKRTPG